VALGSGNGTATQVVNSNGSVTLTLANVGTYGDTGFYVPLGTLGSVVSNGFTITTTDGTAKTNLYFDTSGDGKFFAWADNGCWSGLGGDNYSIGNAGTSGTGTFTVDHTATYGAYTISQLNTGSLTGVTTNTQVAVWVGIQTNSGSASVTITVAP
jgi:hypothetical protein